MDNREKVEGVLRSLFDRERFESTFENEKFEAKLNGLLADGSIVEVSVKLPVSNLAGHVEHWYMDKENGDVFRYVPPEFPAKGIWELVDY